MRSVFDENFSIMSNIVADRTVMEFFNKLFLKENIISDLIIEDETDSGILYLEFLIPDDIKNFDYISNYLDIFQKINDIINLVNTKNTTYAETVKIINCLYNLFLDIYFKRHEKELALNLEFNITPVQWNRFLIKDNVVKLTINFTKKDNRGEK